MRKHKPAEGHVNHERWLVSYADFITLLFAFFVVMYAISSVNEGKYKVLSSSLKNVFETPPGTTKPIELMHGSASSPETTEKQISDEQHRLLVQIRQDMVSALTNEVGHQQVKVSDHDNWIEVSIQSELLFTSGSAVLSNSALVTLAKMSRVLARYPNAIRIQGYTDNIPVINSIYPSNWELSAARAVSVLRVFEEQGVESGRMAAVAYGEFHPVVDNNTDSGRIQNRRVVVAISKSKSGFDSPFEP